MHGLGIRDLHGGDERGFIEVTSGTLGRTDAYGAVGGLYVKGFPVGVGINRDRLYVELLAGPYNP